MFIIKRDPGAVGLQIAHGKKDFHMLGLKASIIYILGALRESINTKLMNGNYAWLHSILSLQLLESPRTGRDKYANLPKTLN